MKIRENENILREDYTDEEYRKFYELDKIFDLEEEEYDENEEYEETEEEKEYSRKYALNRVVEIVRNINKQVTPNKIICPKEREDEINSLFLALFDWKFFALELDYDEFMPKMEDVFDENNTPQDKTEFIYKYYCYSENECLSNKEIKFKTIENLISKAKKDIKKQKEYILKNYPEEYEIHIVK